MRGFILPGIMAFSSSLLPFFALSLGLSVCFDCFRNVFLGSDDSGASVSLELDTFVVCVDSKAVHSVDGLISDTLKRK